MSLLRIGVTVILTSLVTVIIMSRYFQYTTATAEPVAGVYSGRGAGVAGADGSAHRVRAGGSRARARGARVAAVARAGGLRSSDGRPPERLRFAREVQRDADRSDRPVARVGRGAAGIDGDVSTTAMMDRRIDIQDLYRRAKDRWTQVEWPLAAYRAHVGAEVPPFPTDLYLGGAAGHRVDSAWSTIETDLAPDGRRIVNRLPTADTTADDLWAEAIVKLMSEDPRAGRLPTGKPPARIIRYRGLVRLLNYLITVTRRLAIERHRKRRHETFASQGDDAAGTQLRLAHHQDTPDEQTMQDESARRAVAALRGAWNELTADQQFLLAMVYRHGTSQRRAATWLGWTESKTSRASERGH